MKIQLFSLSGLFFVLAGCSPQAARLPSQIAQGNIVLKADSISVHSNDSIPTFFANNKDVRITVNHATVKFRTSVELRDDIYKKKTPSNKPLVRVTVTNEKGEIVETQQREGAEIDWEAHLLGNDGNFDVKASLVGVANSETQLETQVFLFKLDASAPAVSSLSTLRAQPDSTERTLSVALKVSDGTKVTCTSHVAPGVVSSHENMELTLSAAEPNLAKPDEHTFTAETMTLSEDYPNTLLVKTKCNDVFGLTSEITEAVNFKQPTFNINGVILAEKAVPHEDKSVAGAPQRFVLRTATGTGGASTAVPLSLKLIDKATNAEAPPSVLNREKARLQVYLSNYEFVSANDANESSDPAKKIFLRKLFANALNAALPSSLTGKQNLFLSMTQIQESNGQEVLLGSHPLFVYVEPNGKQFAYEWKSDHQFVPAALNATLNAQIRIAPSGNEGSPFKEWPVVEYSTNGNTWTPFASGSVFNWESVNGATDTYKFKMKYPFSDEQPFRIRVTATSVAGNVSTSPISKNFVAPSNFSIATTPCNGAGLAVAKGSSFLCKKDVGSETKFFAMIVARNNGNSTFTIPNNVTFDCASGYCITITDTRNNAQWTEKVNVAGSVFQSSLFVNGTQVMFPYGMLKQGDIATHPTFGATFGVNGPNCAATPAPSVALKGSGLNLIEGPFSCD
jgi:hypothetical protein